MAARLKGEAAPAVAKALNLDSAEAVESAMNAALEVAMAARALVRSLPLPAEARLHLDRAESEAVRAAQLAVRGFKAAARPPKGEKAPTHVRVEFADDRSKQRKVRRRR
jgi:2-methylcitrate dehydratase PrpD